VIASRWPVVAAELVAMLRADPALSGVDVLDGPPVGEPSGRDVISIGHALDDADDVAGSAAWAWHATGGQVDETSEIRCAVQSVSGSVDLAVPRARAFAILDVVQSALRADWTAGIDGAWSIDVSAGTVRQAQTELGSGCRVEFTVTIHALI